ncbi:MAG: glycoside hydrolase [Bacteroidales bacterium]|nr:glycoside hydrolase [Bacteroidales bacterium]MCF8339262.1 glycoside hydrolase [Bacteroidales bacterium]
MKTIIKHIALLLFAAVLTACTEKNNPVITTTRNFQINGVGNNQRTFSEDAFNDSVGVFVYNKVRGRPASDLMVQFDVIRGGGSLETNHLSTNVNGKAMVIWNAGTKFSIQELKTNIYDKNGEFLNSVNIQAYAFSQNRWDTVRLEPDINISYMAYNTDTTLMTASSNIYAIGDRYFDWELQSNVPFISPRNIEVAPEGNFFLSTWNGELYKSTDSGASWEYVSNPIQGWEGFFEMQITPDGNIWVSTRGHPLHCSKNGGETWSVSDSGIDGNSRVADIARFTDGDFLMRNFNKKVYISSDDGNSWEAFPSPDYTTKLLITDQDEIIAIHPTQEGYTISKSSDMGESYQEKIDIPLGPMTTGVNVKHFRETYYIGVSGAGVYATKNFEQFDALYENTKFRGIFVTGNGVLIGTHQDYKEAYYRKLSFE